MAEKSEKITGLNVRLIVAHKLYHIDFFRYL